MMIVTTMKMKRMMMSILVLTLVLLSACGDDEKTPNNQFNFSEKILLKGANLYLAQQNEGDRHVYRTYFITNGVYEGGNGWSFESYSNATFIFALQAGTPLSTKKLQAGSYPLSHWFDEAPETENVSWVSFESNDIYYETPYEIQGGDPVILSGGFDDGKTMTIRFTGTLRKYLHDSEQYTPISGNFYFKGKVQDVRSQNVPE